MTITDHCHLPFVDGSISVVSDGGGLNNTILGTRQEAVKEIYRVLETGGKLITGLAYICELPVFLQLEQPQQHLLKHGEIS